MAQTVKVPYFTVNVYGQLTKAGETTVQIPDGTTTWSEIDGKPVVFPPATHEHPDLQLKDTGTGQSLVLDSSSNFIKKLDGARSASITDDGTKLTVDVPYPYSSGISDVTPPTFTDNGDGTGTFAACNISLFDNPNYTGIAKIYSVPEATLTFTEGQQEYAVIKFNGGSPVWAKETNSELINGSDTSLVYVVWRQSGGSLLHSSNQDSIALGLANKINSRILNVQPYAVSTVGGSTGLIASETATPNPRTLIVSGGIVYKGVVKDTLSPYNSSVDLLTKAVFTGTGWTYTYETVYDNTHYNPYSGGESVLTNNKYAYRLYFRSVGDVREVFYVESPDQYNTEALARAASEAGRTSLPQLITGHCILVGRSIIQKGATSGITEAFVRTGGIFISGVPSHNDLPGIQGGATGEYYHLTLSQSGTLGKITESGGLPLWDGSSWPGGGAVTSGTTTVDFGYEKQSVEVSVAYPGLTASSVVRACINGSEEAALQSITCSILSQTPGVGFTILCSAPERASGTFTITYTIQ